MPTPPLDTAAHVIQTALTPIFLLTAVGSLLNVFAARLARILDQIHAIDREGPAAAARRAERNRLRLRSRILDAAVLAATGAGCLTCCAAATIFFGTLGNAGTATLLFGLFGGALVAAIVALACFAAEVTVSGRAVRQQLDETERE